MIEASTVWGAWSLESFAIAFSDERPEVYPFGSDATGLLTYTPSGHMSAVLARSQREPLAVGRLERSGHATDHAKAQAFDSYLSYGGRYSIEGQEMVHHVEFSLTPDICGTDNRRSLTILDEETIALSYEITAKSGVIRRYRLIWKRLP